ncbi:hypothetical protein Droror1_Dr00011752 [Drosera rotundifolia]
MDEQEEALFSYSYSSPSYYVQSPSTPSHAHNEYSRHCRVSSSSYNSPPTYDTYTISTQSDASRLGFSQSKSSDSFVIHSKKSIDDLLSITHVAGLEIICVNQEECSKASVDDDHHCRDGEDGNNGLDDHEVYDDFYEDHDNGGDGGFGKFLSFGTYPSSYVWTAIQLAWRSIVSLVAALLVFYIVTKPPSPHVSIRIAGFSPFELTEGVDSSGVATSLLTCNCTVEVAVDNKSKVFSLYILPPFVELSFDRFIVATSHGAAVEILPNQHEQTAPFELYVGTKKRAMYGAGRAMEDVLRSMGGLPLAIKLSFTSRFHVIRGLINPEFRYQTKCFILLQSEHAFDSRCNDAIS